MMCRVPFYWIVVLSLLAVSVSSCKKDGAAQQQYDVGFFNKINTGEHVHVVITQENQQSINAVGGNLEQLQVYVVNGELFVMAPDYSGPTIEVNIAVPQLSSLVYRTNSIVTFSGDFIVDGNFKIDGRNNAFLAIEGIFEVEKLSIDVRDNAILSIEHLEAEELYLIEKNDNFCNISGKANKAQINLFNHARFNLGEGNFKVPTGGPLQAAEYYVEMRGESQAWVYATSTLWVEAYDNCHVFYKGIPTMLIQNLHHGSTLSAKE